MGGPDESGIAATGRLYTVPEVALKLRCSGRTVWSLVGRGDLRVIHVGRRCFICEKVLEEYLTRTPEQAADLAAARRASTRAVIERARGRPAPTRKPIRQTNFRELAKELTRNRERDR